MKVEAGQVAEMLLAIVELVVASVGKAVVVGFEVGIVVEGIVVVEVAGLVMVKKVAMEKVGTFVLEAGGLESVVVLVVGLDYSKELFVGLLFLFISFGFVQSKVVGPQADSEQ